MGQHFLFHRELVAATAVHHAVHARLTNDAQRDLVLVGPQWLRVYRVEPFGAADAAKGQVLHLVAAFQLAGVAESVRVLHFDRGVLRKKRRAFLGGQDVLLLSFARFKWVIVGYDRRTRALVTLAMFSFAEDAIGPGATLKADKNGREQLLGIATESVVRVDPQTRCGAMLVYTDQLVIVPFRSESMELSFFEEDEDEDDDEEEEDDQLDGSKTRSGRKDGAAPDDGDDDDDDDDEEKKLEELVKESKQRGNDAVSNKLMTLLDKSVKVGAKRKRNDMSGLMPNEIAGREFLLRLRELEICGKIVDMAFLDGYLEPTLMILHEENDKISTAGRLATGYDTYCLTVISINLNTRMHPKIWSVRNLPSDSFRLIPCRAPLGGVVVLAANAILYFNQTQFYGIATNIFATKTVNQSVYPLEDAVYESPDQQVNRLNVVLNDCEYTYLGQKEILLALPTGELFALGLPYDDTATRSYGLGSNATKVGLSLKLIRSGVSMNCMAIDEERKTLFIGSRSGDSVLFAFEEAKSAADVENGAVKSDGGNTVANKEDTQPVVNASVQDEKEDAVKPEVEDVEEDEDDLFLYGSAATSSSTNGASTASAPGVDDSASNGVKVETPVVSEGQVHEALELNSYNYSLSPIDRLTGVGQITSLELGIETNVDSNEKREQLVASGGYLQDGAISVLHHGLRPIVGTEAELNGCRAMWTVSSSLDDARKSDDGRIYNSYLILSIGQRTMVLRTGEGMDPLEDNSGFYTSGPTLAAANLFGKQRIVQVFKQGARVMMEVPVEEGEKKEEKPTKSEDLEGAAANGEDEDDEDEEDDGPQVKLICTQEITLEGDVESGGMNVDTSSVGIVSVDVIDPFILLLLTDGTVRLLMGDDDMELTVIDPEREIYSSSSSSSNDNAPSRGISAACLFYDWAGMFQDNAWGEDEREERNDVSEKHDSDQKPDQTNRKGGSNDVDEDMDDLYSSKPSPRFKAHHAAPSSGFKSPASGISAAIGPDSSVSVALLARSAASMMCALCFEDGSLHVFSLPDFKKKGIFPYLTFAPQRLVNTMEHYQANRKKTVRFAAPVLGLNASSASANEGRIKKSHTINSPVADITIHRVGPAEGQHNAQYFARMVLLVFLANGDLLMYAATPKMGNPRGNGAAPSVVSFQFVRIGSDLITRPFLPPKAKAGTTHNETGNNPEANTSAVLAKLRAGFRYSMLTRFNNINNMSGAFFRGAHPMWILSERGFPTFVPMCVPPVASPTPANGNAGNSTPRLSVPVLSFTPFHHWNCPNGFIYFHSRGALRVCELPSSRTSTILPLSRGFVLHKAELGVTIHKLLFLGNRGPGGVSEALETPTYALVCSRRLPMAEAERATEHENPEDDMEEEVAEGEDGGAKSNVMAPTAEMFPDIALEDLPMSEEDVYELRLVQTNEFGEWNARTGVFRVHFERYEVVLSVQLMYLYDSALMREDISSRSSEWARKKRPYLVVGTGYVGPHGEDESGRGRLLLYELDYAQYVNDDGSGATSSKLPKLRLVFIKEHRQGAISSVTQLGPYVLAAVGSKLIVYEFKSEQLIGCAFYDAQTFIVSLSVVRGDFVVYADVYKSAHFLRWREMQRQLVLLAKDYEPLAVTATEFSVFERKLALLATDMEENLHVMQFAPHDVESRGGQRLLRTADFHLGVQVIAMLRKRVDVAPTANVCYVNLLGSSEGSLAALVPVPERVFRRLFTLQNVMINTLPQNCALNPRDFRALKSNSYRHAGRPDAWTKHKWKKSFLDALVLFRFLHLDYVAQKELARCIGTTPEVVTHNLLEVQRATAAFL